MKLRRRGKAKFHGWTSRPFPLDKVEWDQAEGVFRVTVKKVNDFAGISTHNYELTIDAEEFCALLEEASKALEGGGGAALATRLAASARAAQRLSLAAAGALR